jgi:hypothetical protein
MATNGKQLLAAVTRWASVRGDEDTPEWKAWDAAWHDASDEARRDALVSVALTRVVAAS